MRKAVIFMEMDTAEDFQMLPNFHTYWWFSAPYIAHKMQLTLCSGTHFSVCSEWLAVRAMATALTTSADTSAKLSNENKLLECI